MLLAKHIISQLADKPTHSREPKWRDATVGHTCQNMMKPALSFMVNNFPEKKEKKISTRHMPRFVPFQQAFPSPSGETLTS